MSSYKGHTIFAFLLSLLFFTNPIYVTLVVIGANIPDFDHKFKKERVYQIIILGLVVFISLYVLKLSYYLGLIIVFIGCVFFFSAHRSFTHSIFGLLTLTASVSLILIFAYKLIISFSYIPNVDSYFIFLILVIFLGFLFLNRKVFLIFLPLTLLGVIVIGTTSISYIPIAIALFIGILSHIILDAFTPSGIKIFAPLSKKKVHKGFGIISCIILLALAVIHYIYFGNLWINYFVTFISNYIPNIKL